MLCFHYFLAQRDILLIQRARRRVIHGLCQETRKTSSPSFRESATPRAESLPAYPLYSLFEKEAVAALDDGQSGLLQGLLEREYPEIRFPLETDLVVGRQEHGCPAGRVPIP